jgi:hypothetical protein
MKLSWTAVKINIRINKKRNFFCAILTEAKTHEEAGRIAALHSQY